MPIALRPALEVLENEDGYHGGPDLPHDRVLVDPHKGFDAQVLLDELEKALYLPARLVERTDGFGIPRAVVGHQLDGVLGRRPVFAASLARPWENVEAERHRAGVQQLYARRVYTLAEGAAVGLLSQQFLAQPPVDLARHPRVAAPVLLAQRVSGGSLPYSQVAQLPPDALHAQLDVAQRLAVRQLAEYHGDKMRP